MSKESIYLCCSNVTYFLRKKVWVQEEEMEFLNLENKSFNNFYFFIRAANQLWDKEKFKLSCEIASVMWLWDPKNILGAQCVTNGCHLWKMTYH